jgi:murein L,D-transpeptidase YcbB/YkuD
MKKMLTGIVAVVAFSSCTQVAGWFGNNTDSTQINADSSSYAAYARDESITAANAYSDLFLDSNAVEGFIQQQKLPDTTANVMRSFYRVRNYQYAWFSSEGPTEQARGLWSLYASGKDSASGNHSMDSLSDRMDTLLQKDSMTVVREDSSFIQTELALTQNLIHYASSHPQHISRNHIYYMVPAKKVDAMTYADSILHKQKDSSLYSGNRSYAQLKSQLASYYTIAKNGGWGTIPSGAQLKKGSKSPVVASLKKRLSATNDYGSTDTSAVYSDSLATAVKAFQERNGLKPTGIVNDSMVTMLNVPVEERIQQLLINMNRSLWLAPQTDSSRIEVNIPSQMLVAYSDSGRTFEMPVIVGREGNSTVMFSSAINQIVFNPSWNIPESIVKNEIMPKMKSDATYLKKNNIEVVSQKDSIPVLRQLPGKENALGKIKFLFPNTHDIYLHDTPDKALFAKKDRALSHGCIRVADAARLAQLLLQGQNNWNAQSITNAMNNNKEQTVTLDHPYPVTISYFTAFVDETGYMNFRDDIYGHDKDTMKKMFL